MGKFASRLLWSSAFLLTVLLLLAGLVYFSLKKGVGFDQCTFGDISVQRFHVRLDKKLTVDIGDITISAGRKQRGGAFSVAGLRKAMLYADAAGRWIESVTVRRMTIGDTSVTFDYNGNGSGSLAVRDPAFHAETGFTVSGSRLSLDVHEFNSLDYHSRASGTIELDMHRITVAADLLVDLAGTLPLKLHCEGDRDQLTFEGSGTASVQTIRPVVELFQLGPDIQPWITDYLRGSSFRLALIRGTIPYKSPARVFETLYGKAFVQDCEYSFEEKLPAIKSPLTEVVFENGVLKIYPQRPVYAGVDAGRSWLDIDFNPREPVLSAYIKTETPLGDEILNLLNFYDIRLPFRQTQGATDADLTLKINLETIDVSATGEFKVATGAFHYDNAIYTVGHAAISLVNDEVAVKDVTIGLRDILKMKATGMLKIASSKADLDIAVEKVDLPLEDTRLTLDNTDRQLRLAYHLGPEGEKLTASASAWKFGKLSAKADGFTGTFHASEFSGTLPPTLVNVLPATQFLLSGDFHLKRPELNLAIDLQKWETDGVRLDQAHLPLAFVLKDNLEVSSATESGWQIKGKKVQFAPFKLNYAGKKLAVSQAGLRLGGVVDALIQGKFDLTAGKGSFLLDRVELGNTDLKGFNFSGRNLQGDLAMRDGALTVTIPELGLSYERKQSSAWQLHVDQLGKLYDRSAFLQRYNLNKGTIDIRGASDTPPYIFSGNISSSYDFLVKENIPVGDYAVSGQYDGNTWSVTVNDDLHLLYGTRFQIRASSIGFNLTALRTYLADHPGDENDKATQKIPDLDLQADNSSIYLNPFQSAPAEQLTAHADGGQLTGQLKFGKGRADLEMNSDRFTLFGQGFGEAFMQRLLKDSSFIGGRLSFYAGGLFEKYKGVVKIDDSVIKKGAILNNILAFINTVPDLITFSYPEYSLQGLPFNQLYAGFQYDNHIITVDTFAIESHSLDMTGTGILHLQENTIEMNIDLVSKTKKNISKIPLLGYLLVGDEKLPTITLDVHGDLDDPEVSTSVYKEIVKTPFNILLRTISLPSHLLRQLGESGDRDMVPETSTGNGPKK